MAEMSFAKGMVVAAAANDGQMLSFEAEGAASSRAVFLEYEAVEAAPEAAEEALEERLKFICDLWQEKRGSKPLPTRSELDPAEFHRLWPVTFLLERDEAESEWYVRFAGAAYGSVYGREITGARVRDLVPENLAPKVLWLPAR